MENQSDQLNEVDVQQEPIDTTDWAFTPNMKAHRKNTRLWCKGKVGVPHTVKYTDDRQIAGLNKITGSLRPVPKIEICTVCGKHMNRYSVPQQYGGWMRSSCDDYPEEVMRLFAAEFALYEAQQKEHHDA